MCGDPAGTSDPSAGGSCWELYELIDACSRDPDMPLRAPANRPPGLLAGASAHFYGVAAARVHGIGWRSSAWRTSGPLRGYPIRLMLWYPVETSRARDTSSSRSFSDA